MRAHNHIHQITQVREIRRLLRSNWYTPVVEDNSVFPVFPTGHDIFENYDFVGLDIFPNRDDGTIGSFSVKEKSRTNVSSNFEPLEYILSKTTFLPPNS